jgi:hypothetical protein
LKNVAPETSPNVSTWPLKPIYMMKKVSPENSAVSTWHIQPNYVMKKFTPEISPTVSTMPIHYIYM